MLGTTKYGQLNRYQRNKSSRRRSPRGIRKRLLGEILERRDLLAAGDLDTSFGTNGSFLFDTSVTGESVTQILSDDRVQVVTENQAVRTLADGTPDPSFGPDGDGLGQSTALRSGGIPLVRADGSYTLVAGRPGTTVGFASLEVRADGVIDSTSGDDGITVHDVDGLTLSFIDAVRASDGGFFVLLSDTSRVFIVTRHAADGARDLNFGTDGVLTLDVDSVGASIGDEIDDFDPRRIRVDANDNPVIFGGVNLEAAREDNVIIVRSSASGQLDTGFGQNGFVVTPFTTNGESFNSVLDAVILPDGGFAISDFEDNRGRSNAILIHRLDSTGAVVPSFGDLGTLRLGRNLVDPVDLRDSSFGLLVPSGLDLDDSGNFLVTVYAENGFNLLRVTPQGQLDPVFGTLGVASFFPATNFADLVPSAATDSQGRLLLAGSSRGFASNPTDFGDTFIVRLEGDSPTFSPNGRLRFAEGLVSAREEDGQVVLTIRRDEGTDGEVSVRVRTLFDQPEVDEVPGVLPSASPNLDFESINTDVTFAAGQTTVEVTVALPDDGLDEAPETFLAELSLPTGGAELGGPRTARITLERQGDNPADLNPDFGDSGVVVTEPTVDQLQIGEVLVQRDQRIVVVGTDDDDSNGDFLIRRFNNDGSVDTTFSQDGLQRLDFGQGRDLALAVDQLTDGSLIVTGQSEFPVDIGFDRPLGSLVRVLQDGTVDVNFADRGRIIDQDPSIEAFRDVVAISENRFLVLARGERFDSELGENVSFAVVRRYLADGSLDPEFGQDGEIRVDNIDFGFDNSIQESSDRLAVDPVSGRIFLAGTRQIPTDTLDTFGRPVVFDLSRPIVVGLTPDGELNPDFGDAGIRIITEQIGGRRFLIDPLADLAVDPDGNVVFGVGFPFPDPDSPNDPRDEDLRVAAIRLQPDGMLDAAFGNEGIADSRVGFGTPDSSLILPDGRIFFTDQNRVFAVLPDGRPDQSLAEDNRGFAELSIQSSNTLSSFFSSSSAVTPDGGVIIAGVFTSFGSDETNQVGLVRLAGSDSPGVFELIEDTIAVDETQDTLSVEVLRRDGATGDASVRLQTRNQQAIAGGDFVAFDQVINFADGQTLQTVTIDLIDDSVAEGAETFLLDLTDPIDAGLGAVTTAEVTILDGPGQISFADAELTASETQGDELITLSRVNGVDGEVSVRLSVAENGTATANADFVALDQVVTFADGQDTVVIPLRILDDEINEGIETINLVLSDATGGASLGQSSVQLQLFDVEEFQQNSAAGAIDSEFGDNGFASLPEDLEFGLPIGSANIGGGAFVIADQDFRIVGVRSDGQIDTDFGVDGVASIDIPFNNTDSLGSEGFTVDNQGRFLLVGRRNLDINSDFVVARFTAEGLPDESFGDGGFRVIDVGADDRGFAVAVDPEDRIYLAGSSGGFTRRSQAVIRLNDQGTLDPDFADGGILLTENDTLFEEASALLVTEQGVIIGGQAVFVVPGAGTVRPTSDWIIQRITFDGQNDPSFAENGRFRGNFSDLTGNSDNEDRIRRFLPLSDGRFLTVGSTDGEFLVARFLADGSLDQSYGSGDGVTLGVITPGGLGPTGLDFVRDAILGPDDSLTLVGASTRGFSSDLVIGRLDANGIPDLSFGARGGRLFVEAGGPSGGETVLLDDENRLLIATRPASVFGGTPEIVRILTSSVSPLEGSIQFSEINNTISEAGGQIEIMVNRPAGSSSGEVSINFSTINGTAEAGLDFVGSSGTVTFADSESSQLITIDVLEDEVFEDGGETFFVVLEDPTGGAVLGAQFTVPVGITDNDPIPRDFSLFISAPGTVAEDVGTATVSVNVLSPSPTAELDVPVNFSFTTVPTGSATPEIDFVPTSGTVTIPVGSDTATIPIDILFDDEIEVTESFDLIISGISGVDFTSPIRRTIRIANIEPTFEHPDAPGNVVTDFGDDGFSSADPTRFTDDDTGPISTDVGTDGSIVQLTSLDIGEGIAVIRTNPDGSTDTSFGEDGIARIPTEDFASGTEIPSQVRLLEDGSVLVFGLAADSGLLNLFALRLTSDGILDSSFGDDGAVFTSLSSPDTAILSSQLAPDGSIYFVGSTGVQRRADNTTIFNTVTATNSRTIIGFSAALTPRTFILRLTPEGQLDTSFGTDGAVLLSGRFGTFLTPSVEQILFDAGGNPILLVNGFQSPPQTDQENFSGAEFIRLTIDGELISRQSVADSIPQVSAADVGVVPDEGVTPDQLASAPIVSQITTDDAGDFVLFGSILFFNPDGSFLGTGASFVARLSPELQPRTEFADSGLRLIDPQEFDGTGTLARESFRLDSIAAQPDGYVILVGRSLSQLAVARLRPDGLLDQGFGGLGVLRVPNTSPDLRFGPAPTIVQATNQTTTISFRDDNREISLVRLLSGPSVGAVRLFASRVRVAEDDEVIELLVRRVGGVDGEISVDVSTANGSAIGGVDFVSTQQTLTFADGEFEQFATIPLIDDDLAEGDLEFTVSLSNVTGGAKAKIVTSTTVTIVDDEQPGRLQFALGPLLVEEGVGTVEIPLERLDGDGGTVSVQVAATGTATDGQDFELPSTTVTFAAGTRSQTLEIPITDDDLLEDPLETIVLTLSDPTGGAELGFLTTTFVDIRDDEFIERPPAGTFSVTADTDNVSETGETASFTVNRVEGSEGPVTVRFAVDDGTAEDGSDFLGFSGSIVLADGQTSRSFVIPILDDDVVEGDETFSVRLTSVSEGRLDESAASAIVTINDDDSALVQLDLGDAPASFGTLLVDGGPSHVIVDGFSLGAAVTAENDGIPIADASGDDADDGIIGLPDELSPGQAFTIQVSAMLPDDLPAAVVQGWLDLNGDGQFTSDEQILSNLVITESGTQTVDLVVPSDIEPGLTFARFRISSLASLGPNGPAPDGEVEDYAVTILGQPAENTPPVVNAGGPFFVNEGSPLQLVATGTDIQDGTDLTFEFDLDFDGTFVPDVAGPVFTTEPIFDPPRSFTVTVRATDSEGLSAIDTALVTVQNLPPVLTIDNPVLVIADGAPATNAGTVSDPGNDPVTLTASRGTVTVENGQFFFTDVGDPGTVTITATDDDGATTTLDFIIMDEVCSTIVTNTNDDGDGSLRSAIECSNATAGVDTISFDLPVGSNGRIVLDSELPTFTDSFRLVADLSPTTGLPGVVVDGSQIGAGTADGFVVQATGNSDISGVAIINFSGDAVDVSAQSAVTLTNNFLGVDPLQLGLGGNGGFGVLLRGADSVIGGPAGSGTGNRIGNNQSAVVLIGPAATGNVIEGNELGASASNVPIGTADNFANQFSAVHFTDGASGNTVSGNIIGGSEDGVRVVSGIQNEITTNTFVAISSQPIDLGVDGVDDNDPGDLDEGANRLINSPEIDSVTTVGGGVTLVLSLDATTETVDLPLVYEVYSVSGDGVFEPLGQLVGETSHTGVISLAAGQMTPSQIAVIVTDASGNTSEFSETIDVAVPAPPETMGSVPFLPGVDPFEPQRFRIDVNGDSRVTPLDALLVVNQLIVQSVPSPTAASPAFGGTPSALLPGQDRFDVSGDGWITPLDALQVINELASDVQALTLEPARVDQALVEIESEERNEELEFLGDASAFLF